MKKWFWDHSFAIWGLSCLLVGMLFSDFIFWTSGCK